MRRDLSIAALKRYVDGPGRRLAKPLVHVARLSTSLIKRAYPIEEIRRRAIDAGWAAPRIETTPVGFVAWMSK